MDLMDMNVIENSKDNSTNNLNKKGEDRKNKGFS
jgi:hypothetical protein